jgi:hypothetical protein
MTFAFVTLNDFAPFSGEGLVVPVGSLLLAKSRFRHRNRQNLRFVDIEL